MSLLGFMEEKAPFTREELRAKDILIRDSLQPDIVEHGKDVLDPDTVLELMEFFLRLLGSPITYEDLRFTRIFKSVACVSEASDAWPDRIVHLCEELLRAWNRKFGPVTDIHTPLYEPGARLYGIAGRNDHKRKDLIEKWHGDPSEMVSPERAMEHGTLEFEPGQWWIHPVFAYHAGIITYVGPDIGITADGESAYAIVMTEQDEEAGGTFEHLCFMLKPQDPHGGRVRGCILPVKTPIRLLRSHTLNSDWRPRAGVRYDGLYMVIGWSSFMTKSKTWCQKFELERLKGQKKRVEVLKHPTSEEVDDYVEYRRNRVAYEHQRASSTQINTSRPPSPTRLQDRSHASTPHESTITTPRSDCASGIDITVEKHDARLKSAFKSDYFTDTILEAADHNQTGRVDPFLFNDALDGPD